MTTGVYVLYIPPCKEFTKRVYAICVKLKEMERGGRLGSGGSIGEGIGLL